MLFRPGEEITISDIAARIPKTSAQTRLEAEQGALSKEWEALHNEQRAAIAKYIPLTKGGGHSQITAESEVRRITALLEQTQRQQHRVAVELEPYRRDHGGRLAAALLPKRRELATQALDALSDLSAVWVELEQLAVLVEAAGGDIGRCPPLALHLIESRLRALAGK